MTALREAAEAALKELESLLTCEMKRMPMFVDQSVVSTLRAALSAPQVEQSEPAGREDAFFRFCATHCSPGAERAEWYRTIWNEAWNAALAAPQYTYGHCENKAQPGGCQMHNLQCGYPDCDRKLVAQPQAEQPEVLAWLVMDDALGVVHAAGWKLAAYEHIASAVHEFGLTEAEHWRVVPVCAATPTRTAVPLTDEETDAIARSAQCKKSLTWLARAIERAHGIVGGGE